MDQYFEHHGATEPEMYGLERHHDLFDRYLDNRGKKNKFKEKPKKYLTEETRKTHTHEIRQSTGEPASGQAQNASSDASETLSKEQKLLQQYKRSEKHIRYLLSWDRILFLITRQYFEQLLSDNATPTLKELNNTVMRTPIPYSLPVPDSDRSIFHDSITVRNVGILRLVVRDRRMSTLLPYYPERDNSLHVLEIQAELQSYRRSRVKLMSVIHTFEIQLHKLLGEVPMKSSARVGAFYFGDIKKNRDGTITTGRHGDFLFATHRLFKDQKLINNTEDNDVLFTPDTVLLAREVRNAFAHNQYVDLSDDTKAALAQSVVDQVEIDQSSKPNPARNRKVAQRLLALTTNHYQTWSDTIVQLINEKDTSPWTG